MEWLREGRLIAHRGLHNEALPENTLGAFRHAAEMGLPIELDLQMTFDSQVVVFHDRDTLRLTGQKYAVTKNKLSTLQELEVKNSGLPMPTFEEVLRTVNGEVPLLIEVKPAKIRTAERAAQTAHLLSTYPGQFAVQSFDPRIVKWFKKNTPYPTGLIVGRYKDPSTPPELRQVLQDFWLRNAKDMKNGYRPDFIAHDFKLLSPGISDHFRIKKNLPLLTWTVKEKRQLGMAGALADGCIFEGFLP